VRLALATVGAVERPSRGGADGTRLLLAQPFQRVLGRCRFLPARLRVLCQPIPRPPLLGDNDFALSLDELSDLRKPIAQIAERAGGLAQRSPNDIQSRMYIVGSLQEDVMQVAKWGNSLAVRLPSAVVDALDLKEGDQIEIRIIGERTFEVQRDRSREDALTRLRNLRRPLPAGFIFGRDEANAR
jgi:antitoxin MazE